MREGLEKYLPVPTVEFDGEKYVRNYGTSDSIGKVRSYMGNIQCILKAYSWIRTMGPDGLKMASMTAVLNNNYLDKLLLDIDGVSRPYAEGKRRLEQASIQFRETGGRNGCGHSGHQQKTY